MEAYSSLHKGVCEGYLQREGLEAVLGVQLQNTKAPGVALGHRQNHAGEGYVQQQHVSRKRPQRHPEQVLILHSICVGGGKQRRRCITGLDV